MSGTYTSCPSKATPSRTRSGAKEPDTLTSDAHPVPSNHMHPLSRGIILPACLLAGLLSQANLIAEDAATVGVATATSSVPDRHTRRKFATGILLAGLHALPGRHTG